MRIFLIYILSLFFTIAAFGQDLPDSGFTNKGEAKNKKVHGLKEGKWVEYYKICTHRGETGPKKTILFHTHEYELTIYKAGNPNGIVRYYADGKLFSETPYINGKKNGVMKSYYDNGNVEYEMPFTNNKLDGMEKWYYESGQLRFERSYHMNQIYGIGKSYYQNGQIAAITDYDSNVTQKYDESKKLKSITKYIYTDSGHYIEKVYDTIGRLLWETPYINYAINGVQKEYYENGKVKSEITYINNMWDGPEKDYYQSGKLWKEFNNVTNDAIEKDGIYKEYYESGELECEITYKHGKEKQTKYYDKNGNEIK